MYIIDNFNKYDDNYDPNKNLRFVNFPDKRIIEHFEGEFESEFNDKLYPGYKGKKVSNYNDKEDLTNKNLKITISKDPKEKIKNEVVVGTKADSKFKPFFIDLIIMLIPLIIIFLFFRRRSDE